MRLSSLQIQPSSNTHPLRPSRRAGIVACRLREHPLEEGVEGLEYRRLAEVEREEGALAGFRGVECRVRLEVPGVELRGEWGGRQEVLGFGEDCWWG